jgi:dUTP pyrophosphatase
MELKIRKMHTEASLPVYQHPGDAGMDLYSNEETDLEPGRITAVSTGIQMAIPCGYVGLVWDKSGLSLSGLHCLAGVVDAGYRGEIRVVLTNLSRENIHIGKGKKIAQILIQPVCSVTPVEVSSLDSTVRGEGGFGSTGL